MPFLSEFRYVDGFWLALPSFFQQRSQRLHTHASHSTYVFAGVLVWMGLVRALRWRRYNAIHRKYLRKWNNGKGTITPEEAQEITSVGAAYDMPLLLNYALAFALFKTYAIPSISTLLNKTKQLSSTENISKRYADTELLIATYFFCPISGYVNPSMYGDDPKSSSMDDPRAMIALARTNYLHSKYQISNNDFLYTLCLFALEPNTWAGRWGWRALSPLERHAYYVFWAEIGRRMDIKDIPDSFESLSAWSKASRALGYLFLATQSNHDLAGFTLEELLSAVPEFGGLKSFARRLAICAMDDIVREAMMYPKQPWLLRTVVWWSLYSVGVFQRWFLLPRGFPSTPVNVTQNFKTGGGCPRLHPNKWAARPWYRPEPTTSFGYFTEKLLVKLGWYSEMPSSMLKSTGYRLEEMRAMRRLCERHPNSKVIQFWDLGHWKEEKEYTNEPSPDI
ncbi:Mycophenolic acid biosynthesis cluster protein B [Psilocybe cubensis]|uniref:Mycophenolic acid biosynthesis cluster protein B n=1 Tax=Psilocybe cubensis TaxID=181762 RepID=A0ACB8GHW0_PSICU|nr:Mycophenolic acid biosynthesis cluster protein B [Psilocybe cubensis]KAH9475208.1 Mycophenolic acid biosynthesis cluster protein B [Psilocybe cubensis]